MAIAYFEQNPDVAAAYAQNSYGMTPEQFAQTHYQLYGASEQRAAPTPVGLAEPEIKDYRGKTYDTQQLLSLAQQLAPTVDYENLRGGVYGTKKGNIGFAFEDSEKALGFTPSVLDQVLLDMSRHLLDEGITSLDQLESRDQFRRFGSTYTGDGGTIYEIKRDPATGQVTTQTWGKSTSDKGNLLTAASIGLGLLGVPASLGGALNTGLNLGLSQAAQGALGGALLGGGTAALGGGDVLQGTVLGGLGGYAQGGGFSSGADMGLNSNLTMAQIESGLGTPGYGYGAQAASSGLFDPAVIGSGAYLQTNYPYDMSEFSAADTQNLFNQVGNNVAAIEQNLVASGVDPLVAADVANQVTLNPNISTYDSTNYINTNFGGDSLYDVNTATQYPTSVLGDTGVNADIAGGLVPDYGITYDQVMADLMAQSPGATEQLENIVNSQVGGTLGPDNIDIGGVLNPTDLGMNSNLTMSQIESGLGTEGYGYGAQAAESGLFNPVTIGSGAYTQTSYPYDYADFASADTSQLYDQVGANPAAIEQNLVASGVDPLVAADIANQVTLNPTITNDVLTNYVNTSFGGNNLYDVNTAAQYPTSVLNGTGGLLTDIPTTTTSTTPEVDYSNEGRNYPTTESTQGAGGSPVNASITTTTTVPSLNDVLNVVKAGTAVAGLVGGASALNQQPTGFEIVPVPSDWKSPTYGQTGQWPALTPIDFGSRDLLRGTQWEKYINPAQPITPVPAPTGMNYGQLMSVLQGGQGGTLSLNDIISGIQSQYGQTNTGTVGK